MSEDLVAPQEVLDPDSLRDVSLFCGVLLVEIYSLSVAFGGPFLEVGYFLLVVISQTIAGAYIWAKLREHERILPLPELLAMGFAIGSASAAISQLIIRDLLGIRLFLSPLVPVIAVIIWRTFKKNPQLPVQISHAKTNTLLWLLFPAPLALLNSSLVISIIFIAPLLLLVRHIYYQSGSSDRLSLPTVSKLSVLMISTSLVHKIIFSSLTKNGSGISRIISDDIRFDIAHSIGFAKWGFRTNIGLSNNPDSYYKLAHLWLGPILNNDGDIATNLSASILPIFLLMVLGIAICAFTLTIGLSCTAAGLGPIIYLMQSDVANSFETNMRVVWLLGAIYLMNFSTMICRPAIKMNFTYAVMVVLAGFIVTGTRLSYAPFVFATIFLPKKERRNENQSLFRFQTGFFLLLGCFVSYQIFASGNNLRFLSKIMLYASDWPISKEELLTAGFKFTLTRLLPFLVILFVLVKYRPFRKFLIALIIIFGFTQALVPRFAAHDVSFLYPLLLLTSPLLAVLLVDTLSWLRKIKILIKQFVITGGFIGCMYGVAADLTRSEPNRKSFALNFLISLLGNIFALTVLLLITVVVVTASFSIIKREAFRTSFVSFFVIVLLSANAGLKISQHFRPITEYVRYGESLWVSDPDPLVLRWQDKQRLSGLDQLDQISKDNDVFAGNFGLNEGLTFADNLRLPIYLNRISYVQQSYGYISDTFPLIYKQKYLPESSQDDKTKSFAQMLRERIDTSIYFPTNPSRLLLENLQKANVKWFVVDLGNTPLRDWEPWATTRFMNKKVAILELSQAVENTD
ncbi:MAG: hypothetical protein D4R92_01780 [Actinobacteria bacterium]|nr:MAG: hypothetical protein D4R92_01780 [Actinomycetota bacterium]